MLSFPSQDTDVPVDNLIQPLGTLKCAEAAHIDSLQVKPIYLFHCQFVSTNVKLFHVHSAPRPQGQSPSSGPGGRTGQRGLQLRV